MRRLGALCVVMVVAGCGDNIRLRGDAGDDDAGIDDGGSDGGDASTDGPAVDTAPDGSGVGGIVVTPTTGLVTSEAGGSATFTIVLTTVPTASVTIPLASDDVSEGVVSTASVVFETATWNVPQTVTITGVDDAQADGDQTFAIAIDAATSADPSYAALDAPDVSVTNTDDDMASILVTASSGLATTEAGGVVSFVVVLRSEPTADVSIALSSSDPTEGRTTPDFLVFTPSNWSTAQTVIVTGLDDSIDDGDQPYRAILAPATSVDPAYAGVDAADVELTNLDDDEGASVRVQPTAGLVTTEAGGTATFSVSLSVAPLSAVTIAVSSSDSTEGTVSPASLVFTPASWSTAQIVTVRGVDDSNDDGDQPYRAVLAAATSADPAYNGVDPSDVDVTNRDDEAASIVVQPTSGLVTTEAGGAATFTIRLATQPSATVTIPLSSSDPTEGTSSTPSVAFTTTNWATPQTVTASGVDDSIDDGDVAYRVIVAAASSADPAYNNLDAPDVGVTNRDDDTARVIVQPTSGLVTTEAGGAATFTVVLDTQPTANVTLGVSSSDATEGAVGPASLVFTAANWSTPQTVTVRGVDDALDDGDQLWNAILAPATSTDAAYAGLNPSDVSVRNVDDDAVAIRVQPTSGLVTTESGGDDAFAVALASQPTANVTIAVSSSDPSEGTTSVSSITFTPATWNVPRTIGVTGVDDTVTDGNIAYRVVLAPAASADPSYNGIDPADVAVTNLDNDIAGIVVAPTTGLVVSEAGTSDTFEIRLAAQPSADVTIGLSSSDTSEGTVSPTSVTFTPTSWNIARTITVTGVNDPLLDGDQPFTVVTAPATSADAAYNGLNGADVSVTNVDDEKAMVIVTAPRILRVSEAGRTARFAMQLSIQPLSNVTCTIASSDPTEGRVAPQTLTFTPANFAFPQIVIVSGVDDAIDDGDQLFTIINAPCTSVDSRYNGSDPRDLPARNRDND